MDEYISKEKALKMLQMQLLDLESNQDKGDYSEQCENRGARDALDEAIYDIRTIKAADVQHVKHGKWETWGYVFHGIEWERCSVCGKTADISYIALLEGRIEPVTPSFCGCCGARTDGDAE